MVTIPRAPTHHQVPPNQRLGAIETRDAIETNKTVLLSTPPRTKHLSIPATIRSAYFELKKAYTNMKSSGDIDKNKAFIELIKTKLID